MVLAHVFVWSFMIMPWITGCTRETSTMFLETELCYWTLSITHWFADYIYCTLWKLKMGHPQSSKLVPSYYKTHSGLLSNSFSDMSATCMRNCYTWPSKQFFHWGKPHRMMTSVDPVCVCLSISLFGMALPRLWMSRRSHISLNYVWERGHV